MPPDDRVIAGRHCIYILLLYKKTSVPILVLLSQNAQSCPLSAGLMCVAGVHAPAYD